MNSSSGVTGHAAQPKSDNDMEREARRLHVRVLEGDRTALSMLAELVVPPLVRRLARKHPERAGDEIETAVHDAFLTYMKAPSKYDPARSALFAYLFISARGDLLNAINSQKRRDGRIEQLGNRVADEGDESEPLLELPGPADTARTAALNLRNGEIDANIARLFPDSEDWGILHLMIHGVRETEQYAIEMGIEALPIEEQRTQVKRAKDRIRAVCLRHKDELLGEASQGSHD